jgi:hypothetical protein
MNSVLIRGESVAASCCASLLERAGVPFRRQSVERPKLPAIMIGETAQRVLSDIFPGAELFKGLPRIRKRVVKWGAQAEALALPHSAIVVSEQALLLRLEPLPAHEPIAKIAEAAEPDWTIFSARPLPEASHEIHFGSRVASASAVTCKPGCDPEASWVESVPDGWLFLLPNGENGWLLSVGAPAASLLAQSFLISRQILRIEGAGPGFSCSPRLAEPLCGPGWLACGSAALGFDPLCGDGSGYAAREAILASAVVRAAAEGADASGLAAHYRARLRAGFERHLEVCAEFYRSGHSGPWWDEQQSATLRGLAWCRTQRAGAGAFQYRLSGFSLEAVGG